MQAQEKPKRAWSDKTILRSIPNPSTKNYQLQIRCPEITFLGAPQQPDFADITIIMRPDKTVIELKSLKFYFQQFRNLLISYERLINVIFEDLMQAYKPKHLKIIMKLRPRGGISSRLVIDSLENTVTKN